MSMVQINFNFVAPSKVIVSRVDPTSKQESKVGAYGLVLSPNPLCPEQNDASQRWATHTPFRPM
jgi:hypothetical protein